MTIEEAFKHYREHGLGLVHLDVSGLKDPLVLPEKRLALRCQREQAHFLSLVVYDAEHLPCHSLGLKHLLKALHHLISVRHQFGLCTRTFATPKFSCSIGSESVSVVSSRRNTVLF